LGRGGVTLPRAALEGFEPSRHAALSGRSPVLATCNGTRGAALDASRLFLLDGDARAAFCAERARYLALLGQAHGSRSVRGPTVRSNADVHPFELIGAQLLASIGAGGHC